MASLLNCKLGDLPFLMFHWGELEGESMEGIDRRDAKEIINMEK